MVDKDFSTIHLTCKDKRLLKKVKRKKVKYSDQYRVLKAKGYVDYEVYYVDENRMKLPKTEFIKLTETGSHLLMYKRKMFIKEYLFHIINLSIALAALVTAIISIVMQ